MRIVFVGASSLAATAARQLSEEGHEVVLIDKDAERLEDLGESLDCGMVHGDGSRPHVLEEVGPEQTDFLFCLSDVDEANLLAALVGRSLGFGRVVPKMDDVELEPICTELGLDEVIVPDRAGARSIRDLVEGRQSPEVSAVVRAGLRFFSFSVLEGGAEDVASLGLPDDVRAIAYSRGEESALVDEDTDFEPGDEVILLAAEKRLDELVERFSQAKNG